MQSPQAHGCCNVRVLVQVMQIYQMDAMNFRFMGHPSAWVVHRPHAPSSGYNHTFTGEAYTQVTLKSVHQTYPRLLVLVAPPATC